MANRCVKCSTCGNRWPDNAQGREHIHLTLEQQKLQLKLKYRVGQQGWDKVPNPRTNPAKKGGKTIRPRRKAYGPF